MTVPKARLHNLSRCGSMTSSRILSSGLMAGLIISVTLGCSGKDKPSGSPSSSVSPSSNDGSDKDETARELERLKKANKARDLIDDGEQALKEGRYDDARKAFKDAQKLDPDNRRAERGLDAVRDAEKAANASAQSDELFAESMK